MHARSRIASLALLLALLGCSTPKPEPEIASAAPQGGYAEGYASELTAAATAFSEDQAEVKRISGGFGGYPRDVKGPGKPYALEVVTKADESGRSWAYVETLREVKESQKFLTRERDEITRKIAGSVNYAAKQKGCDVEIGGVVAHAFKETVDKQLEKRLREGNEGHRVIDRNRDIIGKDDVAVLEKQADDVAYASYLAHIDIVEQKLRVQRMVEEAETIKQTADRDIAAEREAQKKPNRSDADKKASEERIAAMTKAKGNIDSAVTQAKGLADLMEDRIAQTQKEYADALAKLKETLERETPAAK